MDGALMRQLREAKELKQESLASKAGLDLKTICRMENGRPAVVRSVHRVAHVLDVDYDELVGRKGESSKGEIVCRITALKLTFDVEISVNDKVAIDELIEDVKRALLSKYALSRLSVTGGSIVITVQMTNTAGLKLLYFFWTGILDGLRLIEITIPKHESGFSHLAEKEFRSIFGLSLWSESVPKGELIQITDAIAVRVEWDGTVSYIRRKRPLSEDIQVPEPVLVG